MSSYMGVSVLNNCDAWVPEDPGITKYKVTYYDTNESKIKVKYKRYCWQL